MDPTSPPERSRAELEDRIRALEEELEASRERTRTLEDLIEHAPVPIAIGCAEDGQAQANAALVRRMEELELDSVDEILSATHPDGCEHHVLDMRYPRPGGRYDWERLSVGVRKIGGKTHTLAVLQDITELKRTEARLQTVTENLPVGCVISSRATSEVRYVNPAMAQLFGTEPQELVGRSATGSYDDPGDRDALLKVLEQQGTVDGFEVWFAAPSGRRHRLKTFLREVEFEGERCLMGVGIDVTDGHLAKVELQRALDHREVLLREIHHRVMNNLQVISSLLYLQADSIQEPEYKRIFESNRQRIAAMAMVHDALSASERARMPIDALVPRMAENLLTAWSVGMPIDVRCSIQPLELPRDMVVPSMLIVNELVSNAIKHAFGPSGGTIAIAYEAQPDGTRVLCVEDDGMGMGTSEPSLGLTLVGALVEQLRGTYSLERREGGGTRCEVRLPDPETRSLAEEGAPE